ncbi:TPA: type I restriction-modification system subunit M [Streptococcus suis]|nr:type I restriction-modification system subunit M [Streptococcus suis]HEM3658602.1 type I restriction-modification system subunit M [Streptococcus suis]
MAMKKSELYSRLWKSCDQLRGGMDASQYKDYILVLLFMRYVTDKYYGKRDALIEVPEGGSFHDLIKLKGDKEIGDKTNIVIRKMADANDLVGVITVADFNDADKLGKGKEMVDRLTNLVAIFEDPELDFGGNGADGDDILGDAYEYLMKHFATESGKSKGQFYTPAEVSRIMAKVIGIENAKSQSQTIYDPTCGSGSLLLKAADEAQRGVTIYGQEKDVATVALAKMNMILHGNEIAEIQQGDTISSPEFKNPDGTLKTFDFAVANPPFSTKSWSSGLDPQNDEFDRFTGYGIPPAKNGDYAFLLHFIKSLKSKGKGAIILPHGVLFRGNAEAEIRKNIIRKGYFKGIIGLPANLFYGTGIPAAILVIDKENAEARKGIFMIDASKGFIKDGNKNRLREQDVHKIVEVFNKQLEIPKFSRMVSVEEIESNEYNLNIPRYIDNQEEEDMQDIAAHLQGGIPAADIDALQKYWDVYPTMKESLFRINNREGYYDLKVENEKIKEAVFKHQEFILYSEEVNAIINGWAERHKDRFLQISSDIDPKVLIHDIAEDILESFSSRTLIDKYDIYQYMMTYWLEEMKDDVYMIVENGWIPDKDLVPENLVIDKYFFEEKAAIESLEAEKDEIARQKEEFEEENSGEEGYLEEIKNDKGNITKGSLKNRIKDIKDDPDSVEELEVLEAYLKLVDDESDANKKVKDAMKTLDKKVNEKYKALTEDEIKTLVVDMKWIPYIVREVNSEMDRVSHRLASRVKELAERYDETLSQLEDEVKSYTEKVEKHLERMGFAW